MMPRAPFCLALCTVLFAVLVGPSGAQELIPGHWIGPGPLHELRVSKDDDLREVLDNSPAVVKVNNYGAFLVYTVDDRLEQADVLFQEARDAFRDEYHLVAANGYRFDTTRAAEQLAQLPEDLRIGEPTSAILPVNAGLYLVQFEGPVKDAWVRRIEGLGLRVIQYLPMNAYVLSVPARDVALLEALRADMPEMRYAGVWQPAWRLAPTLRAWRDTLQGQPVPVTVQVIGGTNEREAADFVGARARRVIQVFRVGPYLNVQAEIDPARFAELAHSPRVFAMELLGEIKRLDERQGQIVAGNISGTGPSSPGYLAWLASMGFDSTQFGGFSVNVVDDATSLTGHPDLASSRIDFTRNPTNQTGPQGGHGFLNANIVAGFNSGTGSAVEDSGGYNYGLGIAPWAHVGSTAIFGNTSSNGTAWEDTAYSLGARISTNSWGFSSAGNPIADYDSNSQAYDSIVRDARAGVGGNQELMVVFAAGNDGSGSNTVSTPGTAKNVLTVGASENNRQTGTDGCAIGNAGANNVDDIISFSSRGPVNSAGGDGRWKPEIVAPGTHIEAGVPQSNYNGSSVCNQYFPSGQTLYGWSSGTSHSTPAVAGGAALVYQHFLNNGLSAPSPAMQKAVLVNAAEYMTGVGANDTLPSNSQGMGRMNLGRAFDTTSKMYVDQTQVLTATGTSHTITGNVASSGQPFRVTLCWTDAPGPTTGAPYVNDLDLTVTVGGTTYRGNVFAGAHSIAGGSADFRNNTESVFLPAGVSGPFTVTVTASNIAGDGVPGNGDTTDQDFAVVIYNAGSGAPAGPVANFTGTPTSGTEPLTVAFTDSSTGGVTSWSWDFGDGATSTAQNPSHTYAAAGSYSVTLTVSDGTASDTLTRTNYITVNPAPAPGVADGDFENQSAGAAPSGAWTIDFGTAHVINPAGGTTSDGGMPSSGTQWLEIGGDGTNNATPPSNPGGVGSLPVGGAGVSQSFTVGGSASILEFEAQFLRNEAANQTTFNDWMSVDVTANGTTVNVFYKDTNSPTAGTSSKYGYAITPVETVSVDLFALFPGADNTTQFNLTIQTGNGGDSIQPSKGYVDNIRLTAPATPPVADFSGTPLSGTTPLVVAFSDLSTGGVTSWSWDFGDGTTSTAQNPSHTYTSAGSFDVTLTVTGPGGSDTLTKTAYVTATTTPPVADFSGTPLSGAAPLIVAFTDLSTGSVTSWSWNFGDGASSTAQNPSHTYASAGTYTVSLTVTGPGGSDTMTKTGYVVVSEAPPVADFSGTPLSGTAPLVVAFTDLSTGSVTSWSWNFGDGTTSTAQNPSHTYASTGSYTVSLTVTGPGGSDTMTKTAYVNVGVPAPTADFSGTPLSGTAPLIVAFTDLSTGSVTSWSWNFGDGASSTAQNPSHTYASAGTYTVSLTVTGPGGSDTMTKTGYVVVSEAPPVADFSGTPLSGAAPLVVAFTDLSTGSVTSWSWNFGDGASSTAQNPSHTYASAGTYTVSLTVTGSGGSDTMTKTGYITVTTPAAGDRVYVSFRSTTSVPGLGNVRDEDIVYYDTSNGTWHMYMDGSDLGLAKTDINAFQVLGDGSVAFSLNSSSFQVPGLTGGPNGTELRENDIALWQPTSTGFSSAGPISFLFDGSDVGLTSSGEDIDGIYMPDDMSFILISTKGSPSVPGLSGLKDEDVNRFTPTILGSATAGTWTRFFDGSDVGLTASSEDTCAVHLTAANTLVFSTTGNLSALGTTAADEDLVEFAGTFGGATSGAMSLLHDLSTLGIPTTADVDACTINPLP
ncbi:MAG TPA: PKD domain-containing protein [Planctomycetes bacterium]|nr:PKD domain-containing protein [Planctomycetota bacterium]